MSKKPEAGLVVGEKMARRLLKFIGHLIPCGRCVQYDECHDRPEDGEFLAVCSLEDVDRMPTLMVYDLLRKFAGGEADG